ncbi:toll/interleukin-1 receptor domain-containing protein [Bacillus thuringiensis]|uniref:toll/interleukin-1 receptor domain-containing protein n=1 Tax=Bacillus thuringiensis TaxID=1428 RepID=UPI0021D6735C|nr:toll/interleukin-1 receptor domain-containing protein [Bacillus thuringiensis]MCU7663771.1 toll/interleukin-1 receptor domain-containing protein [Bacillus thuringiensis]
MKSKIEQLIELLDEGESVKHRCYVSSEYEDYIYGPEYVSWIQRCKMFVIRNVHEKSFQKDFSSYADRAHGNGESYYIHMTGMLQSLKDYDFTSPAINPEENLTNKIEKIFISHASKDVTYVKALVDLLNDIGVKKSQNSIFCSSMPGYDIPHGASIYEFLKNELKNNNIMVLFVLSDNYYQSAPCLNEMGAAWITSKEYTTVLTPNFDFKQIVGAIDPTKISFKMNDSVGLDKFRDSLVNTLELENTDYKIWQGDKEKYLSAVSALADLEASTRNVSIELEKVKSSGTDALELSLRFINVTTQPIEFQYIEIELTDENGEKLDIVIEEDELLNEMKLMSKENKVISRVFQCDTSSKFRVRRIVYKNTKIKFAIV